MHLPSKQNYAGANPAERSISMTPEKRKYFRDYYHANKKMRIDSLVKYRKSKLDRFYAIVKDRLFCTKCGEKDIACLDFHHIIPEKKNGNVVQMARLGNLGKALLEADKCCVLCSNCHRKLHYYS